MGVYINILMGGLMQLILKNDFYFIRVENKFYYKFKKNYKKIECPYNYCKNFVLWKIKNYECYEGKFIKTVKFKVKNKYLKGYKKN